MPITNSKKITILILFILLQLLPFINKPFHVDDPFYIKMAEQIINDPLRPYSFSINWSGEMRNVWSYMEATFPPLIPSYISLIIKLFGKCEFMLHLMFLIFPLSAGISMFFISKRFKAPPLISALLLVSTPVFLVMSTTLMLDIPLLALWLISTQLFIKGTDDNNKLFLVLASGFMALCVMTKYTGLLLLPILYIYLLLNKKAVKYRFWLLPAILVFFSWCIHNLLIYGSIHFLHAGIHVGKGLTIHKLFSLLTFFSGIMIFPAFIIFSYKKNQLPALIIIPFAVILLSVLLFKELLFIILFTVLVSSTLIFLYKITISSLSNHCEKVSLPPNVLLCRTKHGGLPPQSVSSGKTSSMEKDPDMVFIFCWFLIIFLLNLIVEPWTASRYLILCVPPSIIMLLKISTATIAERRLKYTGIIMITVTLLFGQLLNYSDYSWSRVYPEFAAYAGSKGYNKGYFLGHFGLQYYLEKEGMTALEVAKKDIVKGSYIITAILPDPQKPNDELLHKLEFIERKPYYSPMPLKLMSPHARAGFYSSFWGIFPFGISTAPLEEFFIFRVK